MLRIEPGPARPLGMPVYFVSERDETPATLRVRSPRGEKATLAWTREEGAWKAEFVAYEAGDYAFETTGHDYVIHYRDEGRLPFLGEFGATATVVALAFAIGFAVRTQKRRKGNPA